jgi:Rad3-related DNA helicase
MEGGVRTPRKPLAPLSSPLLQVAPGRRPINYRAGQQEAIDQIVRRFQGGTRVIFLDAPVGAGKSLCHLEIARQIGGAYISTPQVNLVEQYAKDTRSAGKFEGMGTTLVGRRNYPCPLEVDEGTSDATADGAPCTYGYDCEYRAEHRCPYYLDKVAAQIGPTSISTLAYLFTGIRFRLGGAWPVRPLLIVDEAHGLLNGIVEHFAIKVGPETLRGFDIEPLATSTDPIHYLRTNLPPFYAAVAGDLESRMEELHGERPDPQTRHELRELTMLRNRAQKIVQALGVPGVTWVYRWDEDRDTHVWRPLEVAPFLAPFWEHFEYVLLSSGTFVDTGQTRRDLGLRGPAGIVRIPDNFPAVNAPIIRVGSVKLSKATLNAEMPTVVAEIARIAAMHPGDRGIVHCHSYDLVRQIREASPLELRRRAIPHGRFNRNEAFDAWVHRGGSTTIFLGVGMYEGIDLADDRARFQIVVKCPFPDIGDPWVDARRKRPDGDGWYSGEALTAILQAAGRVMRSIDDRGITYILDRNAIDLLHRRWKDVPEWARKRMTYCASPLELSRNTTGGTT